MCVLCVCVRLAFCTITVSRYYCDLFPAHQKTFVLTFAQYDTLNYTRPRVDQVLQFAQYDTLNYTIPLKYE